MGLDAAVAKTEEDEVRGINDRAQLAQAEAVAQQRLRAAALEAGVTLVAPDTVFLRPIRCSAATSSSSRTWCSVPGSWSRTKR